MMYRSVLWNLLFTLSVVFCVRYNNMPSNQLRDVSLIFLRYTENSTKQYEFVVTWNSESKDGSFFYKETGKTSAVFYSNTAKQRYVMKDWPKGTCASEALPSKTIFPTEKILSAGKKFNIIQLLTGDMSFSVKICDTEIRRSKCIASYKCQFVDPSSDPAIVVIDTCSQLMWEVTVPVRISGKKVKVKYTILDNFADWKEKEWLSAAPITEKLNSIDTYTVTPSGTYCPGRKSAKKVPLLPKYFSMYVDEAHYYEPEMRKVSFKVFDFKNHLVREDIFPDQKHNPKLYSLFGGRMLQIVEDYNTGSRFVMDDQYRNCTILPLNKSIFSMPTKHSHMRMKYSYELFNSKSACYQYSGRVHVRGFPADRFICQRTLGSYPDVKTASLETQELYYRPNDHGPPSLVLMRHISQPFNKSLLKEFSDYSWNIINYRTDHTDHSLDVFDITNCYRVSTHTRMELFAMMPTNLDTLLKEPHLYVMVRNKLAEAAGVPPQRLTKIHFTELATPLHRILRNYTIVWFNLLGLPTLAQENSEYRVADSVSLRDAYASLSHMINRGLVIIPGEKQKFQIIPQSFNIVQEREKLISYKIKKSESTKRYSSGDMAALALSFLGIGALGSAMALLCIQRRRRNAAVAYYVNT